MNPRLLALEENFKKNGGRFENFKLKTLFFGQTGDVDLQNKDIDGKGEYFINSGVTSLGIKGRTTRAARTFNENTITIDFFGNAYYRDFKYKLATHNHVFSFSGEVVKNRTVGLYLVATMAKFPQMYSYNNMATIKTLYEETINLPVTKDAKISVEYMEDYVRELEEDYVRELDAYLKSAGLEDCELTPEELISLKQWLENSESNSRTSQFTIDQLFSMEKITRMLNKSQVNEKSRYPVFSSDTANNGIVGYTDNPDFIVNSEHSIYVIFGDHTRRLNFTQESFSVTDNVKVLNPKIKDPDCLLYIFAVWGKQIKNLGYARHWKIARECQITLPVDSNGEIDTVTIKKTVRALKKLVIADVVKFKNEYLAQTKKVVKPRDTSLA